jgi:hypothetical protein
MTSIAALALALVACTPASVTKPRAEPGPAPAPVDAAGALATLEHRLLAASSVEIAIKVQASGAHTAELGANLVVAAGNKVRLDVQGTLDGSPVDLHYASDGSAMSDGSFTPSHLGEAFLLGFTRMGALHNIAVLAMGGSVDHASGDVAEWVRPVDVRWLAPKRGQDARMLQFGLEVAGKRGGATVLWLNEQDLPYKRTLSVQFDTGTMDVEEHYHVTVTP